MALEIARKRATHVPKIKLDIWTQMAIVLATVLGMITTWSFIQSLEWPFPVAATAALALAAFEVAIAAMFGLSVHALVMDEPETPFVLSVKLHRLFFASALLTGTVSGVSVFVLAAIRGSGGHEVLWMLLGLGLVAFSAYGGAALHDNKFENAVKHLEKREHKVVTEVNRLETKYDAEVQATMTKGRGLCGSATQIDHRAAKAFVHTWRKHHREPSAVVPELPQLQVPSDNDLRRRLIVAMYKSRGVEVLDGEVVQGGLRRMRPRRGPVPLAKALPSGSAEGRTS
jgi:hypothetical protein